MNYISIKNTDDINTFIETTNALHDGYIVAVQFHNKGISPIKEVCGHEFDWTLRRLKVRVLITSMYDAVLEMVFDHVLEWRITEDFSDILETGLRFNDNGFIVWTDDAQDLDDVRESDSYVIAEKMKWRIL